MFPASQDVKAFQSAFGADALLERLQIPRENYCGTQPCVVIRPTTTKDETLIIAWNLMREQARWILTHSSNLPVSERYMIIVGWSQSVRRLQGQIFKAGGAIGEVQAIAASVDWNEFGQTTRQQVLQPRWEKDVFDAR
jgi:hypothetical protein